MKTGIRLMLSAAVLSLLLLAKQPRLVGQTIPVVTTLYSFSNIAGSFATTDESVPAAGLIQGSDGNFYGTTEGGGSSGFGTVFSITPEGVLTTLHEFTGSDTDGRVPEAGLVQDSDGNFYGTTSGGESFFNVGNVFSITPEGALTTLHSFNGSGTDGGNPEDGLIQGSDGNFYGTTVNSGSAFKGTVFSISPAGVLTILYSFSATDSNGNNTDGAYPYASLVQGSDGNFYGTTYYGGSDGDGTVFSMTPAGVLTTLHSFNGSDGRFPYGALIQASDGNFYGTTFLGGSGGRGTVFSITPAGVLTVLHAFTNSGDGQNPEVGLVQGSDGNFYGTTAGGGNKSNGTIFSITPAGVLTILYSFDASSNGQMPHPSRLIQRGDGSFYGTTAFGGSSGDGTVFKLAFVPAHGTIQFANTNRFVDESAGSITMTVQRTVGGVGAVSVDYSETDGTAVAGLDYQPMSGTLFWADGDMADKTLIFAILDRGVRDDIQKTFSVVLGNATGGASLGTLATFSVAIFDDDIPPQPTVTLVSPPGDLTVVAGSALSLAASVNDPGGILASVEFVRDNVLVGTPLTMAPYVFAATAPATPGTYTLHAVVTDNQGRTSDSNVVTLTVIDPTAAAPPAARLLTPVNGLNLVAGSTLTLDASVTTDAAATLDHVSFSVDGAVIATLDAQGNLITSDHGGGAAPVRRDASGKPLSNLFTATYKLAPGVDKIVNPVVTAFDNLGRAGVSGVANFHSTVTNDKAPLVAISNLVSPAKVGVGSLNAVEVSASDPDAGAATTGTVTGGRTRKDSATDATLAAVAYFVNGSEIDLPSIQPPYGFTFTPSSAGKYVLHAVATDASGLSTVSDPVVVQAGEVPVVTIAAGGNGTVAKGAKAKLTVSRAGDMSSDLTVHYKVKGVTAGVDYKALPGSVTIPAGSATAKIKFKTLENTTGDGTRTAKIKLRGSTDSSYTLGTAISAKVSILDDD